MTQRDYRMGSENLGSLARVGSRTRQTRFYQTAAISLLLTAAGLALGHAADTDVRRDAVVNATEKVMPSVVNIATETIIEYHDWYDEILRQFYGRFRGPTHQERSLSLGSGVIIDEDGYILTNFHVVHRASRIQIKLWDGREFEADPVGMTGASDVALLKIRAKPGEKFRPIRLAPDDDLLLGETVLALGNPFGLGISVTRGILSSKNRRPATGNEPLNVEDWLQTDAAINPGNSGGPLVNLRGELIGLNVAVYREQDGQRGPGVGFSIPVKQVSAALARFLTPEATESLWFGAQVKGGTNGLTVISVLAGSPAARGGLTEGDRVMQVNGEVEKNLIGFTRSLCASENHLANLLVSRGAERRKLEIRLIPFGEMVRTRLGCTLLEPTPQMSQRLGIRPGEGLFIEEVEKNGPAANAEIQRGFLLTGIDGQPIRDLQGVGEALAGRKAGETIGLTVVVPRRLGANYVEFRQAAVEVKIR